MRVSRLVHILFSILLLVLVPSVSAVIVWQDDFNYVVDKGNAGTSLGNNVFATQGPWTIAKTEEYEPGADGYVYTTNVLNIPMNTVNPSQTSLRALVIESLPSSTITTQTDVYIGRELIGQDSQVLPADVWIQFWHYVPRVWPQTSEFSSSKLLYPCKGQHGSCQTHNWLVVSKLYSTNPFCANTDVSQGFYVVAEGNAGQDTMAQTVNNCDGNANEIGVTSNTNDYFRYNTWYLMKYHINTSGPSASFELFAREYGSSTWVNPINWKDAVNPGFTWQLPLDRQTGHDTFRLGTTISYDTWLYFMDFTVATTESDLPTYSGEVAPTGDRTIPVITITNPAYDSFSVRTPTITLSGTASDNVGVSHVMWCTNDCQQNGTATGTTSWSATVPLQGGINDIDIIAFDTSNNGGVDSIRIRHEPTPTPVTPQLLFFDDFEYAVSRTVEGYDAGLGLSNPNPFVTQGGWRWVKSNQFNDGGGLATGANGFIYTTSTIEGFTGVFPGQSSSHVAVLEALPITFDGQTDYYLELGSQTNPQIGDIPPDVWFQFWMYTNEYGSQMSDFAPHNKWLYPTTEFYPVLQGMYAWLVTMGSSSSETTQATGWLSATGGDYFVKNHVPNAVISWAAPENQFKLGPNIDQTVIQSNQWTLIKIHINTSWNDGQYEMWMKSQTGDWVKTTEWLSGVTPNFDWKVDVDLQFGHKFVRMPTTQGYDTWTYVDDFAMANAESALPVYTSGPDTTNPVIQITSPTLNTTYVTNSNNLTLSGIASDNVGITSVSYACTSGCSLSGSATGTVSWSTPSISFIEGLNGITITATDAAGNSATDTITINYTTVPLPDTINPIIQIISPTTSNTYSTAQSSITLSGSASDDNLETVIWQCTNGCSGGTLTGTTSWSLSGITLQEGVTDITVTANDTWGNIAFDMLTVTYAIPPQTTSQVVPVLSWDVDSSYGGGVSGFSPVNIDDDIIMPSGIDGIWMSDYNVTSNEHWVVFYLDGAQWVNNVTVYWTFDVQYDPAYELQIQTWDGSSYTTVATMTNTVPVALSTISFNATLTDQLRLFQPSNQGRLSQPSLLSLTEVDLMYDAPVVPVCTPVHEADTTCGLLGEDTCGIGPSELGAYISRFFNGEVTITQLIEVIGLWKNKPGC